jgi:lipoic acid synthetase
MAALELVLAEEPEVFNHNVETIPRLYPLARPQANYERSLAVLKAASDRGLVTKSGIMVGIGELPHEVHATVRDLAWNGISILTVGQYLAPSAEHLPVTEFISPARFDHYALIAHAEGIRAVSSGPFVRSSYSALASWQAVQFAHAPAASTGA